MSKLTYKFNFLFLLFIIFIFLAAIFWLYQKHDVGNDSTISEWLINYQGGFTRRGIIGEICFKLADFFNLSLRFVIFLFQSFLYLIYLILIYFFIKDVPKNILTIIAIFSPIFLLYPIAEIEVLARKEIFLYVGFIIFLNLSNIKYSKNFPLIYIFFIFPILCLIWEPFIFYISFAVFIIFIRNNEDSLLKKIQKIFLSLSSSLLTIILILLNPLTSDEHLLMVNSLMNNFDEICYMSCSVLGTKTGIKTQFMSVYDQLSFVAIFRYSIIILVGFSALIFLTFNTKLKDTSLYSDSKLFNSIISKNLFLIFNILLLPSLILFSSMTDWGRAVNQIYTFSILTYIYLIKNNLVKVENKVFIFDNIYVNKKKIFIFLFVIFAFGWNQKTAITGDISTNSLYKIVYNSSKKIFNLGSTRLFQNSPIIKFHKKYVE
ncbi:hypothetical protein N8Z07_01445 [Pelagibacteraceae bacterium]|nr:hypothetical protein [Pelagibacteraceae bacterium]